MVVELTVFVYTRKFVLRFWETAIEESVVLPSYAGEFYPHKVVIKSFAGFDVLDENFFPVATVARNCVAKVVSVVGNAKVRQGNSAIVRQLVGVEEFNGFTVE